MFWLSGLTRDQGKKLATCHVYMMPSNGRMNLCGLNNNNLTYFADTLAQIVRWFNTNISDYNFWILIKWEFLWWPGGWWSSAAIVLYWGVSWPVSSVQCHSRMRPEMMERWAELVRLGRGQPGNWRRNVGIGHTESRKTFKLWKKYFSPHTGHLIYFFLCGLKEYFRNECQNKYLIKRLNG